MGRSTPEKTRFETAHNLVPTRTIMGKGVCYVLDYMHSIIVLIIAISVLHGTALEDDLEITSGAKGHSSDAV